MVSLSFFPLLSNPLSSSTVLSSPLPHQSDMDGSLASIFMDSYRILPNQPSKDSSAQNAEELQFKLMHAAMELDNAKASARAEEKLQEARIWQLQELLSKTRHERDEAREQCRRLQERLLLQKASPSSSSLSAKADSPCSFIHSSSMVSSPSSSVQPWASQECLKNDGYQSLPPPAPMELQQALQSFSQTDENPDLQAIFDADASEKFSLDILDQDLQFEEGPALDLADLAEEEVEDSFMQPVVSAEQPSSVRSLSRQSSSNSSSACVHRYQMQGVVGPTEAAAAPVSTYIASSSPPAMVQMLNNVSPCTGNANAASKPTGPEAKASATEVMSQHSVPVGQGNLVTLCVSATVSPTAPSNAICPAPPCVVLPLSNPMPVPAMTASGDASPAPSLSTYSTNAQPLPQHSSLPIRQVHLPEPPEADPQVMLSSLPEKGKLLQAVVQAGPLLQTLLLAGPLPQWRYPPPVLSTGDIPKVLMAPKLCNTGSLLLQPAPALVAVSPMQAITPAAYHALKRNASLSNVRVAVADPCSRSRKLRRISPATTLHGDRTRMALVINMQQGNVKPATSSTY